MKAIYIDKFVTNYDKIKISEVPKPQPKEGEVLVQIAASGVNFVDLLYVSSKYSNTSHVLHILSRPSNRYFFSYPSKFSRLKYLSGRYPNNSNSTNSFPSLPFLSSQSPQAQAPKARGKHQNNRSLVRPPFILGLEYAGTVISSPPISKFSPGDRVFGGGLGGYAEYITASETSLHSIPSHWDFASSAGFAATAPVSYGALVLRGKLVKGETVLIHAAAGGLGLMAVQIAKAVGARVIATAGSKEKLDAVRRFGADECVNYTTNSSWEKEVLKLTGGDGVDVVYDSVGLVSQSLKCLKQRGRILLIGFAGREGDLESIAMNRVLLRQAQIIGYRFGMTDRIDPAETAEIWKGLEGLWKRDLLKPTVFEREYRGLKSVVNAMKDLSARKVWGKAVVLLDASNQKPRL